MYFVKIDEKQLHARLANSQECGVASADLRRWLEEHGFQPARDGWYADARGMNSLHCREIRFSIAAPSLCYADGRCVPLRLQATA